MNHLQRIQSYFTATSEAPNRKGIIRILLPLGIGLLLLILPYIIQSNYLLRVIITMAIYALLASGLNIINGYTGQFSLGNAAFYGIGAYTAAILATRYGVPFWVNLLLGGFVAMLFSLLLGMATLRLKGVFLSVTTLGFAEIIRLVILNWIGFTRGPMGIPGIPFPKLFGFTFSSNRAYYYLILVLGVMMIYSTRRVVRSRVGRAWIAIREDEVAARAIGIPTFRYKLLAFALSTFWVGVTGAFYAYYVSYVSADSFTLDEGFTHLAMILLGGQGTIGGPVLGAILLTALPEFFRGLSQYRMVLYGAVIVISVLARPQGILGKGASHESS